MDEHKGQVVGYVRVSAAGQNEAGQLEALGPVNRLFSEKVSGKNTDDRAQLQEMLIYVRDGSSRSRWATQSQGCWCWATSPW